MKGFAMLKIGQTGWIEKEAPQCGPMFEIDTLIASLYYRDEKADWAVIETGLGGRLDSTNVLHHPRLEVITTIGYDHMDRLGSTLTAIAGEKAGIIKPGSRVVMSCWRAFSSVWGLPVISPSSTQT